MKLLVPCVFLMTLGCATQAKFKAQMDTWVGSSADSLVTQWGPPQSSYPLTSGGKVLHYSRQSSGPTTYQVHGGIVYANTYNQSCDVDLTLDALNTIIGYSFEGNACRAK